MSDVWCKIPLTPRWEIIIPTLPLKLYLTVAILTLPNSKMTKIYFSSTNFKVHQTFTMMPRFSNASGLAACRLAACSIASRDSFPDVQRVEFYVRFPMSRHCGYSMIHVYIQHNNNCFTALCPWLPRWAGTRRNTHSPTVLIIIQSLSASSIYHDP